MRSADLHIDHTEPEPHTHTHTLLDFVVLKLTDTFAHVS